MIEVVAYRIDLPDNLLDDAIKAGLVAMCLNHGEYEVAAGQSDGALEDWIDAKMKLADG